MCKMNEGQIKIIQKMSEKVLKYIEKHKKCQYCKHLKIVVLQINVPSYQLCCSKGKIIIDYLSDMTSVRRICSCYEVDGNRYE